MFDRSCKQRTGRLVVRGAVGAAVVVLTVGGLAGTASAQETDDGPVDANVEVSSSISLTGLTSSFTLSGIPGQTVVTGESDNPDDRPVTYNVQTNNLAGYTVTVQSETDTMIADNPDNTDSIPIGALSVRETGETAYTPLSDTVPALVHSQEDRSVADGDELSTDFQVVIPFVNSDNYDATLNYVATTL